MRIWECPFWTLSGDSLGQYHPEYIQSGKFCDIFEVEFWGPSRMSFFEFPDCVPNVEPITVKRGFQNWTRRHFLRCPVWTLSGNGIVLELVWILDLSWSGGIHKLGLLAHSGGALFFCLELTFVWKLKRRLSGSFQNFVKINSLETLWFLPGIKS